MPLSAEDIKRNLVDFARRWSLYQGTERQEAQTFLNELFQCYGTDRLDAGARFEEAQEGRLLDLLWERTCIIEMKRPSEAGRLQVHRPQAMNYWRGAADTARNVPAPRSGGDATRPIIPQAVPSLTALPSKPRLGASPSARCIRATAAGRRELAAWSGFAVVPAGYAQLGFPWAGAH